MRHITYVALLRGINVGGNNIMSMADLRVRFEALGYANVTTYINSGNIIFRSPETDPRKLEAAIEAALPKAVAVLVFSLSQISDVVNNVPKSWHGLVQQKCNVIFLHHSIDSARILDGLQPKSGIEELHYHPGVLFWSAQTSQLTKSNMIKLSSNPIYKYMTIRIYNTVRKIQLIMKTTDSV